MMRPCCVARSVEANIFTDTELKRIAAARMGGRLMELSSGVSIVPHTSPYGL